MAYTQTQLEALQAALTSGALRVTFADRTVEYRSVQELKDAIAVVQAELGIPVVKQVRMYTDKGW